MRTAVAPDGTRWEVDRIWLERPAWSRRALDSDPFDLGTPVSDIGAAGDDLLGIVVGIVLTIVLWVAVSVVLVLLFPLLVFLAGLVVMLLTVLLRLASIATFAVEARAPGVPRRHRWRVRGLLRSRAALRELARSIEAGRGPELVRTPGVPA